MQRYRHLEKYGRFLYLFQTRNIKQKYYKVYDVRILGKKMSAENTIFILHSNPNN